MHTNFIVSLILCIIYVMQRRAPCQARYRREEHSDGLNERRKERGGEEEETRFALESV